MSSEVRIGEAVSALAARLTTWGVNDAPRKAHDFVTDMLHQGWRPAAPQSFAATINGGQTATPETARQHAQAAREALRRSRVAPGVTEAPGGRESEGEGL